MILCCCGFCCWCCGCVYGCYVLLQCFIEVDDGEYVDLDQVQEVLEQVQVCYVGFVGWGQVVFFQLYEYYQELQQVGVDVQVVGIDQGEEC